MLGPRGLSVRQRILLSVPICAFWLLLLYHLGRRLQSNILLYQGSEDSAWHVKFCVIEIVWHTLIVLMATRAKSSLSRTAFWRARYRWSLGLLAGVGHTGALRAALALLTWNLSESALPRNFEWGDPRMREVFFYELIELVLGLVFATHVAWARWQNRGSNGKIGLADGAATQLLPPIETPPIIFDTNLLALAEGHQVLHISHDLSLRFGPLDDAQCHWGVPVRVNVPNGVYRVRR